MFLVSLRHGLNEYLRKCHIAPSRSKSRLHFLRTTTLCEYTNTVSCRSRLSLAIRHENWQHSCSMKWDVWKTNSCTQSNITRNVTKEAARIHWHWQRRKQSATCEIKGSYRNSKFTIEAKDHLRRWEEITANSVTQAPGTAQLSQHTQTSASLTPPL